ncbi:hypothetical protein [Pseudooceanicola algae]|uniref:Flavodoxin n=1 Tax=Pseudooceanicola algae TaxID=1537215 RepID=A0A418SFE9_9RHOB|nr:hypothetical protein [Pseudooceanicola algae]QPM89190.1 hypothetical protein PSAL_004030 [Pseudooceanicola algae]
MTCRILLDGSAGETLTVAEELAWQLGAQLHEIEAPDPETGVRAALRRKISALRPKQPGILVPDQPWHRSDLMILGTPACQSHIAPALRQWLEMRPALPDRIAFLCTSHDDDSADGVFAELESLTGRDPVAQLHLTSPEIARENWGSKIEHFLERCVIRYRHSA